MASNYSSDPKNLSSVSNSDTPHSGPGGTVPEYPVPQSASASVSSPSTPGGGYVGSHNRLTPGIELSEKRYKIDKLVAAGGMGAVYKAIDTRFKRPCAVKEMLDEFQSDTERTQAVEWFAREAELLLDLNHPCIPRVRDFFVEYGKHYLVMDFIEGRTLSEVLEKEGNIAGVNGARGVAEPRARSWAQQVCSVLAYLHRQSPPIIFRDLKPSNIMVTDRDEIKLIDFGIARTFQSQRQSTIIMTIGYAPPEQLHGMPEPRSDIYALGATMHKVLTRHDAANNKPSIFSFPDIRTLRPDISPAFEQVLKRALEPNLDRRWSSATEMERAIINLPPPAAVPQGMVNTMQAGGSPSNPSTPNNALSMPNQQGVPPVVINRNTTTGPAGFAITNALNLINANRIEDAYIEIQKAFAVEPNNSLVHRIFGQVFARRRPPNISQAMQAYNRSLQLNGNDPETHKLIGDVLLFLQGQPVNAIPAYIQSLRLNPNDVESHQRLGQCYEQTNQFDPALREYQEAARLAPKQAAIQLKVGQLAMRLNQFPVAERAFVNGLTFNPADHRTRFLLSQVYENEGKLVDAERECSYVVQMMPEAQPMLQRLRSRLGK